MMSDGEVGLLLRRAFSLFPTGVVAMCGHDGDEPVGMAVNSFCSVSLEPALVSVCVAEGSSTWPRMDKLSRIGLSILGADQERLSRQLASRHGNRFAEIDLVDGEESARFIQGATLWLDCSVYDRLKGGDHHIILFQVHKTTIFPEVEPLVFHQSQYLGLSRAS